MMNRRDFLRFTAASSAVYFLPRGPWAAAQPMRKPSKAKRCIVLWMAGGPSQFETFDPKPGMATGGPFRSIPTSVDGIEISELFPRIAARFQDLCLIRSMTSKEGSHARARYLVHTGYSPNPTVRHPSWGSVIADQIGPKSFELPSFVLIGGGAGALGGGYLGVNAAPFVVNDPRKPIQNLGYARGMDAARMDRREALLGTLEQGFAKRGGAEPVAANQALMQKARHLMDSSKLAAFRIEDGDEKDLERYGQSEFGAGCLAARKLIEAGVSAVEVNLNGWDTHDDNHNRVQKLAQMVDPAASALLDDLKHRGLLDETLVVWMGEFGRTPQITPTQGRGHFTKAWCALLAGGGVKGAQVIGKTDERGENVVERPLTVPDLFATFAKLSGIDGSQIHYAGERPIWLVDRSGKPIDEVIA